MSFEPKSGAAALIAGFALSLLPLNVGGQVAVGAGSQLGQDYLRASAGKTTEDAIRRSMIMSWVQGYLVSRAQHDTEEKIAPEIADKIQRGELPPDVGLVLSDPQGRLLTMLQARFGTRSGWIFDPPDAKTIESWLTDYCQQHRSERICDVAATFARQLEERSKTK